MLKVTSFIRIKAGNEKGEDMGCAIEFCCPQNLLPTPDQVIATMRLSLAQVNPALLAKDLSLVTYEEYVANGWEDEQKISVAAMQPVPKIP